MRKLSLIIITSTFFLISCNDNKKKIVDAYLLSVNNNDIESLSNIISDSFSFCTPNDIIDRKTFFNDFEKEDNPFIYEIFEWKSINDSLIETTEMYGTIFQERTDLIPKYKVKKSYTIKENKIIKIFGDTLIGTKTIYNLLSYVMDDFLYWKTINNIDLEADTSRKYLLGIIDEFYSTYPLHDIVTNKEYLVDKFVEFLKDCEYQNDFYSATYNQVFNKIAGLQGVVNYHSFVPEDYKNNLNIRAVEVIIDRNKRESEYQSLKFQFLVNPKNGIAELHYGEINGKAQNKLQLIMVIGLLVDSGSYI